MSHNRSTPSSHLAGTRTFLGKALACEASSVGLELASRLADPSSDPHRVDPLGADGQHPIGSVRPTELVGSSLVFIQASRVATTADKSDSYLDLAWQSLRQASAITAAAPLGSPALFGGGAGFASALRVATSVEERFSRSLQALDSSLGEQILNTPAAKRERGLRFDDFDIISGAAGTLSYLGSIHKPEGPAKRARDSLEHYINDLGQSLIAGNLDRVTIFPENYPLPLYEEMFPDGYINTGLSHGIPGMLLALSIAAGQASDPRSMETIEGIHEWVLGASVSDGWGQGVSSTPGSASGDCKDLNCSTDHSELFAWCYGTPGVCIAMLAAGRALGSIEMVDNAVACFERGLERFLSSASPIFTPTLCHGYAGIVLIVAEFASAGSLLCRERLPQMTENLLAQIDLDTPFGVRDQDTPGHFVDDPTVLTGSAGVSLLLLSLVEEPVDGLWLPFLGS